MTCRLLCACVGAALVGVLSMPAFGIAKPPDLPEDGTVTAAPSMSAPAPLFQLRPTARRTMAGSLLFGIHPALGLLPTDKILDVPSDHPHRAGAEDVLNDAPPRDWNSFAGRPEIVQLSSSQYGDWFSWLLARWTTRQQPPTPEQNDGYIHPVATGVSFACRAVQEPPASEDETPVPTIEVLPMPREDSDVTCPYLRQQMIDRHTCQMADPEIGRDVLANLEYLREADDLVELATKLAREGFFAEAMACCDRAAKLCPGSPCAERAAETLHKLARGIVSPAADTEESAEPQAADDHNFSEQPGIEPMVCGLMKACHLLMSQGMQHQAAELARQAYALDPQRVLADPLVYKMHLLAEAATMLAGSSEESEPPTCPYCPNTGKPIREIVPENKTKSEDGPATLLVPPLPPVDYEVVPALENELTESAKPAAGAEEASETHMISLEEMRENIRSGWGFPPLDVGTNADGGVRLSAECSLGDSVYHLRYTHGSLAIWKSTDASKTKP